MEIIFERLMGATNILVTVPLLGGRQLVCFHSTMFLHYGTD